jgi:hypothetical protein
MRHVFKTRNFNRWMRKTELTDAALCAAVDEMVAGLIDADLGGGIVKKRVALIATNKGTRWFFVFGFEKNERANIDDTELAALQELAAALLTQSAAQLTIAAADGALTEICHAN